MAKPAHNPTDRPVVIDAAGRTLGGGEWGSVDPDAPQVTDAIKTGLLTVHDELPDSAPPEVLAAVDANTGRSKNRARTDKPRGEE